MKYLKNPISDLSLNKVFVERNWIEEVEAHIKSEDELPIVLVGGTGVGKSKVVYEIGEKLGYEVVPFVLSQVNDISDFLGYATKDKNKIKFILLDKWTDIINENEKFKNGKPHKKFVLFFDEYNRASTDVSYSIFTLFSEYAIKGYQLYPQVVRLIGSINPAGEYSASADDLAFKARVGYLIVDWDVKTWVDWIQKSKYYYKNELIKFIQDYKSLIKKDITDEMANEYKGILTPRSWTRFMNAVHHRKGISEQLAVGIIGDIAVKELKKYLETFKTYTLDSIQSYYNDFLSMMSKKIKNKNVVEIDSILNSIVNNTEFTENNYKDLIKLVRDLIKIKLPRELLLSFLVKLNNNKFLNLRTNRDEIFNSLMYALQNNEDKFINIDEETMNKETISYLKKTIKNYDEKNPPIIEDENEYLKIVKPFIEYIVKKYQESL